MENKKGLSGVVTTLILVLLVLAAVGIVWVVINGIITRGAENIDINAKCLEIEVTPTAASCEDALCSVTVVRSAGGDEIAGIKLIFSEEGGEENVIKDFPGNIAALGQKTQSGINVDPLTAPNKVEVAVYLKDAAGEEQLCAGTNPYSF